MAEDLWQVMNADLVEAWGSTKDDDRKGELEPGDVIDIKAGYPEHDPVWLQFEPYSGGALLEPHEESPYDEYWVKRDEITLQRPELVEDTDTTEEPTDPSITDEQAGAALRVVLEFVRQVVFGL